MVADLAGHGAWLVHALGSSPNPLRRRVDRLSAALIVLVLLVAALAVPGSAALGLLLHARESGKAATAAAAAHPVAAVVLTDPQTQQIGPQIVHFTAPVAWTDTGGLPRTAVIEVPEHSVRGQPVTIWIDLGGDLTAPPASTVMIKVLAAGLAFWALGLIELLCVVALACIYHAAAWHAQRAWQREWDSMPDPWGPQP